MKKIDKFGCVVAEDLRDSILNCYLDIEAGFTGSKKKRELTDKLKDVPEEYRALFKNILTEVVDSGIHDFLFALEEKRNGIEIYVDGECIHQESDGLQGEPFTEDGWYERFSQHKEKGI